MATMQQLPIKSGAAGPQACFTRKKLAIVSTHPIQYHAHWFRALAAHPEIDPQVFYCYDASPADQSRAGFGVEFQWDVPLLEGYSYRFLNGSRSKVGGFFALSGPDIEQIVLKERFDAVLINGWYYKAAWQAIFACWKANIPVMVRGDSQLCSARGYLKKLAKYPVYRFFIPRFDACLAVGTRSRNYFLHYGAAADRLFLVPHTIDDRLFQCAADAAQSHHRTLRLQWGLEEPQTVFLFAGKFIETKRPMDFLRAIEKAYRQQPSVAGLMVGDGPSRIQCEQFSTSRGLPVHFTGFLNQSQMVDAYVVADCLVLPSMETWGLVVNEAMSCSRPAVVSDATGCAPDLISEHETGAVFPLGDISRLAEIIVTFAKRPEHLRAMGSRARKRLRLYSLNAAVDGVVNAVRAVTCNTIKIHD